LQPEKGSRKHWEKLDVGNLASRKVWFLWIRYHVFEVRLLVTENVR
jgi:hypothetical protein